MQIKGRCLQIGNHDPTTGVSIFRFFDYENGKEIFVLGMAVEIQKNQQYLLDGDWNQEGTFCLETIRRFSDSKMESVMLLSTCIRGISESLAERIVEALGEDIYSYSERLNLKEQLLSLPGVGKKKAEAIIQMINAETSHNELFRFLSDYGVPYSAILKYIHKEKMDIREIQENPYRLMAYEVPFDVCDLIAIKNHMEPWEIKRIHAMIYMVLKQMRDRGDTRMEYEKFLKAVSGYSLKNGKSTISIPVALVDIVLYSFDYAKVYLDEEKQYVAPLDLFLQERDIVRSVLRLTASRRGTVFGLQSVIDQVEQEEQISFNKEQREAFGILKEGGIAILLGGPGTGKTTTINGILKGYLSANPDKKVLMCAPTGRAAVRLGEISSQPAQTIHKAMNRKWFGGMGSEPEPFPYELIVADEMSMCDTELFSLFLKAAASGTTILIAGDYNQIPSVGPGQILRDLTESDCCRVYRLTQMLRQREDSLIVDNAEAILRGKDICFGEEFQITVVSEDSEIIRELRNLETEMIPRILCPIKGGISGVKALNILMQEKMNWDDDGICIDGTWFHSGDWMVMSANNYEKGYMNGEIGRIGRIEGDDIEIHFMDRELWLHASEAGGMELSYALTFHKSQGTEEDGILIILPSEAEPMASRELLYTAVTRARKKVHIYAVDRVLRAFLEAKGKGRRDCGLKSALQGKIHY